MSRLRAELAEAEARSAQARLTAAGGVAAPVSGPAFFDQPHAEQKAQVRGWLFLGILVLVVIGLGWNAIASVFDSDPPDTSGVCARIRTITIGTPDVDALRSETVRVAAAAEGTTSELESATAAMKSDAAPTTTAYRSALSRSW